MNKKETAFGKGKTSEILYLEPRDVIHPYIQRGLLNIHEKFSGARLKPHLIFGIRSYLKGSKFIQHRDKIKTHHISVVLQIDKDLDGQPDWPLDIQAHDGSWHMVYFEPGGMVLYESAILSHGRDNKFQGNYYRNLFVNNSFVDLIYDN